MTAPAQPKSSGIKWFLAVSGVVFAASAMVLAVVQGLTPSEIWVDHVVFGQKVSQDQIQQAQPQVQQSVEQLEQSLANAQERETGSADVSGDWLGDNGVTYQIVQSGSSAVLIERTPYGITAYGSGVVEATVFNFQFTAVNNVSGSGSLRLVNSHELRGYFYAPTYGQAEAHMTRSS